MCIRDRLCPHSSYRHRLQRLHTDMAALPTAPLPRLVPPSDPIDARRRGTIASTQCIAGAQAPPVVASAHPPPRQAHIQNSLSCVVHRRWRRQSGFRCERRASPPCGALCTQWSGRPRVAQNGSSARPRASHATRWGSGHTHLKEDEVCDHQHEEGQLSLIHI